MKESPCVPSASFSSSVPAGPGPFPVLVNVHGGYWRRGARETFAHWGPYLAARGYAGFTISYRLTKPGKKTYPEAVHDVRAAVQFMRGRAKDFGLDPDRIALWGNSAGAQLAALVALACRRDSDQWVADQHHCHVRHGHAVYGLRQQQRTDARASAGNHRVLLEPAEHAERSQ